MEVTMSALPAQPYRLRYISSHVVDRFAEKVDDALSRYHARKALRRMFECSTLLTEYQLRRLHVRIELEADYRLSQTSYGAYLFVIKRNTLVTCWKVEAQL